LKERTKKRYIAVLLFISCTISLFLLVFTDHPIPENISSVAQADSLIANSIDKFNIPASQVEVSSIAVDSMLTRKTYRVSLPPGFSKTQLHYELHRELYPYRIATPAEVLFPHKDFRIHLVIRETVIRTIKLTTDSELNLRRNFASILIAFEEIPSEEIQNKLTALGEPVSIVFIVQDPVEANHFYSEMNKEFTNILFWLKDNSGKNIPENNFKYALPMLRDLQEAVPASAVLRFKDLNNQPNNRQKKMLSQSNLQYIDASNAIILDSHSGRAAFMQKLNTLIQKSENRQQPIAIVMGNIKSLNWLHSGLSDLKKSGLRISPPRRYNF